MAQTNITTIPTSIVIGSTDKPSPNNYVDNFYTHFNPVTDIVSNPSKLYVNQIFSDKPVIQIGLPANSTIATGSHPVTAVPVLTVAKGNTSSNLFKEIKSLLRGFDANTFYNDWCPVSNSSINAKAKNILVFSFANNLIGDKLTIYNSNNGRFSFVLGGKTHSVYSYLETTFSGTNFQIHSQYANEVSNFGLIFTSSNSQPPSELSNRNFQGLFFGQLGLIMFYRESGEYSFSSSITLTNALYEENLNSKTFFCRITHDKYNATTNPTWVTYSPSLGTNIVREEVANSGHTYTAITGIGLYNDEGQLLAIAKLSQPVLKLVDTELHARVVIQY